MSIYIDDSKDGDKLGTAIGTNIPTISRRLPDIVSAITSENIAFLTAQHSFKPLENQISQSIMNPLSQ